MRLSRTLFLSFLLLVLVTGCTQTPGVPFPEQPGYLLVGRMIHRGTQTNKLVIFDAETMNIWREVALPPSRAWEISVDPKGHIWIGLTGDFDRPDNRVMVFAPDGSLVKTIETCLKPEFGVAFVGERAIIGCADRGFTAVVASVDIHTYQTETMVEVVESNPDQVGWRLSAIAASDQAIVLALRDDRTLGENDRWEQSPASSIVVLDPVTLEERSRIALPFAAHISQILTLAQDPGRFLLLNNNFGRIRYPESPLNHPELMLLDTATGQIEYLHDQPLPSRAIWSSDGTMYVLHKDTTGPIDFQPGHLTRLDHLSPVDDWALPNWFWTDIAVHQGRILLVNESVNEPKQSGLYQFDPQSGELELVLHVARAYRVSLPN